MKFIEIFWGVVDFIGYGIVYVLYLRKVCFKFLRLEVLVIIWFVVIIFKLFVIESLFFRYVI